MSVKRKELFKIHQTMTIKFIVHKAEEGGYWAEVPSLPGCFSQGETIEELKENIKEAIELWLEFANEIN